MTSEPEFDSPVRSRVLLLKGADPAAVRARVLAYGELYPGGAERARIGIGRPVYGWLPVALPVGLSTWHLHNLVKWLEGGDERWPAAADFLFVSRGDPPWAYWLGRPESDPKGEYLAGSSFQAKALQVHVPSGRAVDLRERRISPMGPTLAMMARQVPLLMQLDGYTPEIAEEIELALAEAPEVEWAQPPPADLVPPSPEGAREADVLRRASGWIRGKLGRKQG